MERRLDIPPAPIASVRALERALGVSFATAQVLVRRGLGDEDLARRAREAALLGQGDDVSQLPELHMRSL